MPTKDLSSLRQPPLVIETGGGFTYSVQPPSADRGLLLARLVSLGLRAALSDSDAQAVTEEMKTELTEAEQEILAEPAALERLALGEDVHARMTSDGHPLPDITAYGRYAAFYWVYGESAADNIMLAPADPEASAAYPKPSRSGRSTASGSGSRTARTSGTAGSRSTSAVSSTREKRTARR